MVIGNIVIKDISKLSLSNFNIVNDILDIDSRYPTLLVGYYDNKDEYELDYINKKIDDNLFWTFTKQEERSLFSKELYEFINYCEVNLMVGFKYYFIDPFTMKYKTTKKLLKYFKKEGGIMFEDGIMIYLYVNNITYGFNTEMGEIIGIMKGRIQRYCRENNFEILGGTAISALQDELGDIAYDNAQLPYLYQKTKE